MFRGFATANITAIDLEAAAAWYAEVFSLEPYFSVPGYREFRVGDDEDEFGIIDAAYVPGAEAQAPAVAGIFWHVDDLDAEFERIVALGAQVAQPITVRGEGFRTATLADPFGNLLGIMENAHFRAAHEEAAATATAE
ncbi:VOC family protein [Agromyces seonyuensis]|uniref:VOC family protein n=1 Tax=Agromyces seonyuensis TaxID=2662446 RepID=A0A6I4NUL7_9MICO|nr:VOC family protein [Agromyces seonyuensis]MWB98078.1 VOC family protein [Agromyces seonyuensis]